MMPSDREKLLEEFVTKLEQPRSTGARREA
jgi:hypothetical protein